MSNLSPRFAFRPVFHIAVVLSSCMAATLLSGCVDPELDKQAKFQKQLDEVSAGYVAAVGGDPAMLSTAPSDEALTALRALGNRARGLSGGTASQEESARALAASISRTTGSIALARAAWLESGQEIVRDLAINASSLAADLDAVAQAGEDLNLSSSTDDAREVKAASAADMRAFQEEVRQIEVPAAQLAQRIAEGSARLSQLNQESALLARKARESTPAAGLAFVEEAALIQSDARTLQTSVENDTIVADQVVSQGEYASARLTAAQNTQAAATNAIEFLGTFDADIKGQSGKSREMANELRRNAQSLLKAIDDERAGALKSAYEGAIADFSSASAGAGGSGADSAALANTLMIEELRLLSTQIAGLGAQGRMLGMESVADNAAALATVRTEAEAVITAFKEKATTAADQFANLGEDPALAGLKTYIDGVKKVADGLTVDKLMTPVAVVEVKKPAAAKAIGAGASSGRSSSGESNTGIADPDAFVAKLAALSGDPSAAAALFVGAIDDSTPIGKAMKSMVGSMMTAMKPVSDAMIEKFGSASLGSMAGGMGALDVSSLGNLTQRSNDGTRAVYGAEGGTEITFVKGANGWAIDMSEAMRASGMTDEQIDQMAPMMSMMMGPMMGSMKKAATEVAARIAADEFATVEEAQAALQEMMAAGAAGALGGPPRRR
ncbi:MAG: hypothetical protein DWH97_03270 [Planctomycetota bacterium]|nr:MAG: hypothetical protein DWH97_03270 [Planctomycetota bacterium]RLS96943.1 MAG: hypothetical protein DWI12_00460 [Planctomycetota bacterium]